MKDQRIDIVPCAKPRQTRSDKWKKRPCVMKYRAFADELRLKYRGTFPEVGTHIIFYVPMPDSWSKAKKAELVGSRHKQKPDVDNLLKAVMDALCRDDSHIWDIRVSKFWGSKGSIEFYYNEKWAVSKGETT